MRYQLKPDAVVWQRVDEEVVYLDLRSSKYLSVNVAGAVLWERLMDGVSREELVARLAEEFAIGRERAEVDVDGFLAELDRRGLIVAE